LDRTVTERAGLGELSPVERRVGGGVAYDDLQALVLVAYEFCARPVLAVSEPLRSAPASPCWSWTTRPRSFTRSA